MKSSCCCIYHSQFLSPSSVYNKSHFLMTLLFLPNALNTHENIYIYICKFQIKVYGTKTKISSHKWFCEDIFSKFIFMKIFFPFLKLSPVSILTSLQKISCLCQSSSNCGYFPFLITPQINSKLPLASHYFLTPFLLESVLSVHLK